MKKRTASRAKPSNGSPRPNGRILTVKQLDKRSYAAIHSLPHGRRGPVLKALLKAWADVSSAHPTTALYGLLNGDFQLAHKGA